MPSLTTRIFYFVQDHLKKFFKSQIFIQKHTAMFWRYVLFQWKSIKKKSTLVWFTTKSIFSYFPNFSIKSHFLLFNSIFSVCFLWSLNVQYFMNQKVTSIFDNALPKIIAVLTVLTFSKCIDTGSFGVSWPE